MESKFQLKTINTIRQRIRFLASLSCSPKFYRIISDVVSDPGKLDSTLGTLCYSTLLLSAIIKKYPQIKNIVLQLHIQLIELLNKAILYGLSKIHRHDLKNRIMIKPIRNEKYAGKEGEVGETATKASIVLKDFSGYITDIRIFNRGFSIPGCIADILESGSLLKDKDYLNWVSTICISLYQPFETVAFLFDHNWLLPDRASNNCLWWYAVSTRFWFVWVLAEFGQLSHKILKNRGRNIERAEYIGFIEHLATLPLCFHWSLEEGCLDPLYVGFFGTIAGGISTLDMWRSVWARILSEV